MFVLGPRRLQKEFWTPTMAIIIWASITNLQPPNGPTPQPSFNYMTLLMTKVNFLPHPHPYFFVFWIIIHWKLVKSLSFWWWQWKCLYCYRHHHFVGNDNLLPPFCCTSCWWTKINKRTRKNIKGKKNRKG